MAKADVILADMAKKKTKGDGDKPHRSPSYTVYARISPDLGAAFEAYLNSLRPKPTATAVVTVALEEFLKAKGFWPAAGSKEGGKQG